MLPIKDYLQILKDFAQFEASPVSIIARTLYGALESGDFAALRVLLGDSRNDSILDTIFSIGQNEHGLKPEKWTDPTFQEIFERRL